MRAKTRDSDNVDVFFIQLPALVVPRWTWVRSSEIIHHSKRILNAKLERHTSDGELDVGSRRNLPKSTSKAKRNIHSSVLERSHANERCNLLRFSHKLFHGSSLVKWRRFQSERGVKFLRRKFMSTAEPGEPILRRLQTVCVSKRGTRHSAPASHQKRILLHRCSMSPLESVLRGRDASSEMFVRLQLKIFNVSLTIGSQWFLKRRCSRKRDAMYMVFFLVRKSPARRFADAVAIVCPVIFTLPAIVNAATYG